MTKNITGNFSSIIEVSPSGLTGNYLLSKSNSTLVQKELIAGSNITLTGSPTGITINSSSGSGDVSGPNSSLDNSLVLFNGITGKVIKGPPSSITLDASSILYNLNQIYLRPSGSLLGYFITGSNTLAARQVNIDNVGANSSFVLTRGNQTISDPKTFSSITHFENGFGAPQITIRDNSNVGRAMILATPLAADRTYIIPGITASSAQFVLTEGATQVINGSKTFSNPVTYNAASGQIVLAPSGGNSITITCGPPASNRVYVIPDVGATASFLMTEGSQTINGTKFFNPEITFNSGIRTNQVRNLLGPLTLEGQDVTVNMIAPAYTFTVNAGVQVHNGDAFLLRKSPTDSARDIRMLADITTTNNTPTTIFTYDLTNGLSSNSGVVMISHVYAASNSGGQTAGYYNFFCKFGVTTSNTTINFLNSGIFISSLGSASVAFVNNTSNVALTVTGMSSPIKWGGYVEVRMIK
jgi:hypothetical protein